MFKKTLAVGAAMAAVAAIAMVPSAALAQSTVVVGKCPTGVSNKTCVYKCPPGTTNLAYCVAYKCPPGVTNLAYCTKVTPNPSKIELASIVGVVTHRYTGVVLACFGNLACKGTLTITYGGAAVGTASYDIGSNSVGTVYVKLYRSFAKTLKSDGSLTVTASADDYAGPSSKGPITLYYV
jgi:hypothetical protein